MRRFFSALLALAAVFALSSCQTTGSADDPSLMIPMAAGEAPQGEAKWMIVETGLFLPASGEPPREAYVAGVQTNEGFVPTSHVLGRYKCLCGVQKYMHEYTTGWRDLRTGKFIAKTADNRPERPYLIGQMSDAGKFHADSRAVAY